MQKSLGCEGSAKTEFDLTGRRVWVAGHRGMAARKIDVIFLAAATVGGILANTLRPAEFLYENLVIETNIIHTARTIRVKKLLFLGSSCIYPRMAEQPMWEEALMTGADQ